MAREKFISTMNYDIKRLLQGNYTSIPVPGAHPQMADLPAIGVARKI
jgi:hypothetical protein